MKNLKIILVFSLSLLALFNVYYKINNIKSKYSLKVTKFYGTVIEKRAYDNKNTFIIKAKENILVNDYDKKIKAKLGDYIFITGSLSNIKDNSNFNLFSYRKYLLSKKIFYQLEPEKFKIIYSSNNILYKIKNKLVNYLENINNDYVNAFIIAENSIDKEEYEKYQINGLSHLFSVSGTNVTLITYFIFLIFNKIIKNKKISYFLAGIFLLPYIFITGFSIPIMRSSIFFLIFALLKLFNIEIKSFYILYMLLIFFLLYNPYYIYNTGFIYTFIISLGLMLASKIINYTNNYFFKTFIISCIAFLISIPITINNNFSINLLSPLLNLFFVPFVSFLIFPSAIITLIFNDFNGVFCFLISILEYLSNLALKYKIELVFAHISLLFMILYYIIIILILIKPNKKIIVIFIIILIIHYNIKIFNNYPVVTMIDVGQGDSFLIEMPNNKANILIDTGGNINYDIGKNIIIPFLKSRGISKIDYLFLTHGDYDHIGASIKLLTDFKVDNVYLNSGSDSDVEQNLLKKITKKKMTYSKIGLKKIEINDLIFYNLNSGNAEEENDDSIVLYFKINNFKFLFMGDASTAIENKIIDKYNIKDIDVLKVGHHGSKYSTSDEFIQKLNPKYALISVGLNNYYGHPSKRVIELLEDNKVTILNSSVNGSSSLIIKDKIKVVTRFK